MIGNYKIIEKIGKGSFGIVYKAKRINEPLIYVIKQISLNGLTDFQINQVKTEAKILSLIKSNYVVKYYDSFFENGDLNIVMEYCDNGDLCNYLNKQKQPLKEDLIWQIFIKITLGLTAIHKMKILHRDLKTLNIFLKKDMEIKIGDLGVAKELNQASFASTIIGTPYYLSPEMCEDKPYNQKSDVWALGCILYELCTYRHPFNASNHGALILKILNADPDPIFAIYSSKLQKLVNHILEKNCEKRPNCWDILNTPIVVEKAKKFGLYQEILNVFSNKNNILIEDAIQNGYDNNLFVNYLPLDSEDILLKSQLTAPNNNDNKVHVKKLNKEERKALKVVQNNRRNCSSVDRNLRRGNNNQNNYINDINIMGRDKNQNNIQYTNINNLNFNNNNIIDYRNSNNYIRNTMFNQNITNNYVLLDDNYYLNSNNYNNLYNNNINQNNDNIIYNQVLLNNNVRNNNQLSSIPDINNEPVKCAKVTRIYKDNPSTQNQMINKNSYIRHIDDINDSLNSLNISIKFVPLDMDRITDKNEISTSNIISKNDNEDNYYRYPLNSVRPAIDNCQVDYPFDNIKFINNNKPYKIVNNENIEVKSTKQAANKLHSIKRDNNLNNIDDDNKSSTKNSSLINQKTSDITFISNPIENGGLDIIELNKDNYKEIFANNNNYNNIVVKNSNFRSRRKSIEENGNRKFFEGINKTNTNHKNPKKKLNVANILYKKNTNEKSNKTSSFNDICNNDDTKLNKTSINLSSSDNFNIDYQEPLPIEMQIKPINLNYDNIEESDFNLLKNSNDKEIKKDEQEIPKIEDLDQEKNEKIILKEQINSIENNIKKIQNDINLLIGEKDFKNIMKLYLNEKNNDNAYKEIEKYFVSNKYIKNKKEKFFDLYLLLTSFDSQLKEKKAEYKK